MPRIFKTGKNIIKGNQFRGFGDEREINEILYVLKWKFFVNDMPGSF